VSTVRGRIKSRRPGKQSKSRITLQCSTSCDTALSEVLCYDRRVKDPHPVTDAVNEWRFRLEASFARADALTGGLLFVVRSALRRFQAARGSQAAAALSYYAFFSLFPLLLFLILVSGSLLGRDIVYGQLSRALATVLPVGQEVVSSTIEQVLPTTSGLQILAAVGLLWAGAGFFSALVLNIDVAWADDRAANPLRSRFYGLLIVGVLTLLLLVSLLLNLVLDVLSRTAPLLPAGRALFERTLWPTIIEVVSELVAFLLLFGLYWGVPKAKVHWQAAGCGALIAALAWRLVSWGFSSLVARGLTRYETVYGSLGAVVALLFWLYVSSLIVLLGAHLTSAIDRAVPRFGRDALSGG
jgi:membrane protein